MPCCRHPSRGATGHQSVNVEWWQYIRLNERHNLAMAIKPYLEDRKAHWQSVCASGKSADAKTARTAHHENRSLHATLSLSPRHTRQGIRQAEETREAEPKV